MNFFARAVLLRLDGSRDRIAVPDTFHCLMSLLEEPPPLASAAFMFGTAPAILVYGEHRGPDQRPINIQASKLHPDYVEVRGLAAVMIGERTVSNQNEVEKSIEDVKRHFSDSIGEVRFGKKRVIVTQRGKPSVALVSLDDLEILRQHHAKKKGEAA